MIMKSAPVVSEEAIKWPGHLVQGVSLPDHLVDELLLLHGANGLCG